MGDLPFSCFNPFDIGNVFWLESYSKESFFETRSVRKCNYVKKISLLNFYFNFDGEQVYFIPIQLLNYWNFSVIFKNAQWGERYVQGEDRDGKVQGKDRDGKVQGEDRDGKVQGEDRDGKVRGIDYTRKRHQITKGKLDNKVIMKER